LLGIELELEWQGELKLELELELGFDLDEKWLDKFKSVIKLNVFRNSLE
jgi:hypothetical protein